MIGLLFQGFEAKLYGASEVAGGIRRVYTVEERAKIVARRFGLRHIRLMNYRHIFHAGNICDVVKHAVLTLMIDALRGKDKGFCILDTHAGIGLYDLQDKRAQKTLEAQAGIYRFLSAPPLPGLNEYYRILRHFNSGEMRFYPGSPLIARQMLRPQDRLVLCELHDEDFNILRSNFRDDDQTHLHHRDGYEALSAFLPPAEKRGMVLIDPPYENADEFSKLADHVIAAHSRWDTGVYVIWYPIKDRPTIWRFNEKLVAAGIPKMLRAEFVYEDETVQNRLNGCGFAIINPPWRMDETLRSLFPEIHKALDTAVQHNTVDWLNAE